MTLLELLPCRVTPGAAAGEFLSSGGLLLLPNRVTPGTLAQSYHSWNFCRIVKLLELVLANL